MSQIELTPAGGVNAAPNGTAGSFDDPAPRQRPPDDWQRRVFRALTTKVRLAIVLGLLAGILVGALGASSALSKPTTYHSTAVMLIDDPPALATAGDDGQLLKLDELRLKYSALVSTDLIAQPVAHQLGLTTGQVLGSVKATVPYQSLLMDVTGTSPNAQAAERLAETTANQVTAYVRYEASYYNISPSDRYSFKVIDPAVYASVSKPSHAYALTLGAGLGVLGFVVAFVVTQLTRNRRILSKSG